VCNLARKVMHARKRNSWADRDELLHRCRGPRRNHLCQFLWLPHTGFRRGGSQILGFSIDLHRRPYNTLALPCESVINKCIGDDTKAAARQSLNWIFKNKIWRKTIFNMPDGILTPCNVSRSRHWFRQVTAPCNVACGSGIVTVNSPSGSTLQCDTWLWDDKPLNSPERPPYWNSTSVFHFHTAPQSTCHSVAVCEILFKSDPLGRKKWRRVDFQDGGSQPSWIVEIQ